MSNTVSKVLSEIIEDCSVNKNISSGNRKNGKYPFYTCSTTVQTHNDFHYDGEFILFGSRGSIGDTVHLTKGKFAIGTSMIMVKPKSGVDAEWLYHCLRGKEKEIKDLISGGGVPQLTKTDLFTLPIEIPVDIEEQKRIAGILSNVDSTIKVAEEEYDQLNRLLEGLINNLIGEKELIPLSEYISFTNGYSFKSSDLQKQGVPWVKISNVSFGRMNWDLEDYLPVDFLKKYEQFVLKKEDIVLALTRPIIDNKLKIAQIDKDFCLLNQRVAKVVLKNKDFKELILFLLQSSYCVRQIEELISGMDPPNVSTSQIEKILVPSFTSEEARKVTEILSNLDFILTSKRAEINKLKFLRLGFLRELI